MTRNVWVQTGIGIIAIVLIAVAVRHSAGTATENSAPKTYATLPTNILLYGLDNEVVHVADFKHKKIRIINSWATWCTFCIKELPHFIELQNQYPNDIAVIAINRQESADTQRSFFVQKNIHERALTFLSDPTDVFYTHILGGFSMPETILVTQDDQILFHKRGPMTAEEMRERVEALLAG